MAYLRNELVVDGRYRPDKVGSLVSHLMDAKVRPQKEAVDPVVAAWEAVVPPGLAGHCRVKGVQGSRLQVMVDSPAYLYELQLCSSELIKALKSISPQIRIASMKLAVGRL